MPLPNASYVKCLKTLEKWFSRVKTLRCWHKAAKRGVEGRWSVVECSRGGIRGAANGTDNAKLQMDVSEQLICSVLFSSCFSFFFFFFFILKWVVDAIFAPVSLSVYHKRRLPPTLGKKSWSVDDDDEGCQTVVCWKNRAAQKSAKSWNSFAIKLNWLRYMNICGGEFVWGLISPPKPSNFL